MQSIKQSLAGILGKDVLQKQLDKVKDDLLSEAHIRTLITQHGLSEAAVKRGAAKLYEFDRQRQNCERCPGLERCPNIMQGYEPQLFVHHGAIDVRYNKCSLKEQHDDERRQRVLFDSLYIPKEVLTARFTDVDINPERIDAVQTAVQYVENFMPGKTKTGLYYYGAFGVGKTYLMCAVANELARTKNVQSLIVYTPDYFRDLRNSIGTDQFHDKLNYTKTVPLLILDDIGAEAISTWVRDEVLGSILQYRMTENLPTLYTSNYDYSELEKHLAYSERAGTEQMKAKRIMERIRHYNLVKYLGGENRRENFPKK